MALRRVWTGGGAVLALAVSLGMAGPSAFGRDAAGAVDGSGFWQPSDALRRTIDDGGDAGIVETAIADELNRCFAEAGYGDACYYLIRDLAQWNSDIDLGINWGQQAVQIAERRFADDPMEVALANNVLASRYNSAGKVTEAETHYRRALELRIAAKDAESSEAAMTQLLVAGTLIRQQRYLDAQPFYEAAYAGMVAVRGAESRGAMDALDKLAQLHHTLSRFELAEPLWRKGLAIAVAQSGEDSSRAAYWMRRLGDTLRAMGREREGRELDARGRQIQIAADPESSTAASLYGEAAQEAMKRGDGETAMALAQKAYDIEVAAVGQRGADLFFATHNLAVILGDLGRDAEAEPLLLRVLETRIKWYGGKHPDTIAAANNLAYHLIRVGKQEAGEKLLRLARDASAESFGEASSQVAQYDLQIGILLVQTDRRDEARPFLERGAAALGKGKPVTYPGRIASFTLLGNYLLPIAPETARARTLLRSAAAGGLERLRQYPDFGASAQEQMQQLRPAFTGQVRAAWQLAGGRG